MVKHGMNLIQRATEHVNHGQVPVITVDQPLYAIAKKIQWTWPIMYGESKFVVMLGGLHIEMSFLRLIGDWLAGSGWAEAIKSGWSIEWLTCYQRSMGTSSIQQQLCMFYKNVLMLHTRKS